MNTHSIRSIRSRAAWLKSVGVFAFASMLPLDQAHAFAPQDSTHYSTKWSLISDEEYMNVAKVVDGKIWYVFKNGWIRARNFDGNVVFSHQDINADWNYNFDYTVSADGRLYYFYKDQGNYWKQRIAIIDGQGNRIGDFAGAGRGSGSFDPDSKSIAVSPVSGRVYLGDRTEQPGKKGLVSVFDRDGNFLYEFQTTGILASTLEGAITHLIVRGDAQGNDEIFVVDSRQGSQGQAWRRSNLKVFRANGTFLRLPVGGVFDQEFYGGHPLNTALFRGEHMVFNAAISGDNAHTVWVAPARATRGDEVSVIRTPAGGGSQIGVHDSGTWIRFTGPGSADRQTQGVYFYSYPGFSNFEASTRNAVPNPWVLSVAQRSGSGIVDIDYRVDDANDSTVTTALVGFANGVASLTNVLSLNTLLEGTGARLGANQPTGQVQRVTWNAGGDWNVDFGTLRVMALARDSRSHWFDVHLVEIPADGNRPAVAISRIPLREEDFLAQFFWLVATKDPSVRLVDGVLFGTTGSDNGVILANGVTSTAAGRAFLLKRDGLRIAASDEVTRAREGATPGYTVQLNPPLRMIRNTPSGSFPDQVNEFGIESQRLDWLGTAWYVVRDTAQ